MTDMRSMTTSAGGSQTVEFALGLPVVLLLLLAVLQTVGVVADATVADEAARRGARVAVTTAADGPVDAAVRAVVGDRPVAVTVSGQRRDGGLVTVTVALTARLGPIAVPVTGRATGRGEPALGP